MVCDAKKTREKLILQHQFDLMKFYGHVNVVNETASNSSQTKTLVL